MISERERKNRDELFRLMKENPDLPVVWPTTYGQGRRHGDGEIGGNLQMKLSDTVQMMNSADYKERFKAEYWQTKIRYDKLHRMTVKYEAGTLDFEPDCELSLLLEQKKYMGLYLNRLEVRAEVEGIGLEALKDD